HRAPFTARRQRDEDLHFEANKRRYQDKFCGRRLRGERGPYRSHCRGGACPNFAPPELLAASAENPPAENPPAENLPAENLPEPTAVITLPMVSASSASPEPVLSCIMPTYNRRTYLPLALRCRLRQDSPWAELTVVDDGSDPVGDCLPSAPRIRYVRLNRRLSIGAKRNLACEQARGDAIVHWDDDDWYPPHRLRVQAEALRDRGAEVCGTSQLFYYDAAAARAFCYQYTGQPGSWVAGNTLAYRKSYWTRNPFPDIQVGEDTRFLWSGRPRALCDLADASLCVAMIHGANSCAKNTAGSCWQPCPETRLADLLGDDLTAYRAAAGCATSAAEHAPAAAPPPPLVSCIMPTYNRRAFLPLALTAFANQDYPNKELLVIDDGTDPVRDLVEGRVGVHYIPLPSRTSIGGKR